MRSTRRGRITARHRKPFLADALWSVDMSRMNPMVLAACLCVSTNVLFSPSSTVDGSRVSPRFAGLLAGAVLPSQASTVCAGVVPAGFVTTAISGTCSLGPGRSAVMRTIQSTAGLPVSFRLNVCGPFTVPAGWALVGVGQTACFSSLGTTYLSGTIMNLNGLPSKTTVDVCGLPAPAGWKVQLQRPTPCSSGPTSYLRYEIVKL